VLTSGWEEATAIGTIGAAFMTAWLAASTRKLAREAGTETRANWRPVLVPDSPDAVELNDRLLSLHIRNIGRGPALTVTIALWEGGDFELFDRIYRGHADANVVAPNENIVFKWKDFDAPRTAAKSAGFVAWSVLSGRITYCDVGNVIYETELKVGFRADGAATAILDHQFLGAVRDRIGRLDRLRLRLLRLIAWAEPHLPKRLRGLANRLAPGWPKR
jgi:hypothetical protein